MKKSDFEDFLRHQCALCDEKLGTADKKITTIGMDLEKGGEPCLQDNSPEGESAITNTDAVSQIYGVSKMYFIRRLVTHFQHMQRTEVIYKIPKDNSELLDAAEIVLCTKCSHLIGELFKIQKDFSSAINSNSLIWHTLGKNIRKKRKTHFSFQSTISNIKSETPCDNSQLMDNENSAEPFNSDGDMEDEHTHRKTIKTEAASEDSEDCEDHFIQNSNSRREEKTKTIAPPVKRKRGRPSKVSAPKMLTVSVERLDDSRILNRKRTTQTDEMEKTADRSLSGKRSCTERSRKSFQGEPESTESINKTENCDIDESWEEIPEFSDEDFQLSDGDNISDHDCQSSDASYDPGGKTKTPSKKKGKVQKTKRSVGRKSSPRPPSHSSGKRKYTRRKDLYADKSYKVVEVPATNTNEEGSSNCVKRYLFLCKECGLSFPNAYNLHSHQAAHHPTGEISLHPEKITGPPYNCPKCSESWSTWTVLNSHCLRVHNLKLPPPKRDFSRNSKDPILCTECSATFINWHGFSIHMKRIHGIGLPSFGCPLCEKSFRSQNELESHTSTFHPEVPKTPGQCENDNEVRNSSSSMTTGGNEKRQSPAFQFCDLAYFCRACQFPFQDRGGILTHNRICHNNAKRFDCKHCENNFESTAALIAHLSDVHNELVKPERDEDQHQCLECQNEYYTYGSLRKHRKTSGHVKYLSKCSFCTESFTELEELKYHKRKIHKDKMEGNKSVVANQEVIRKVNKKKLAILEKLEKYQCPFCEEQFSSKKESSEHRATHDKSELFKCHKCSKTFNNEGIFNRHRLHSHNTEEKLRIECSKCDKVFTSNMKYRRHLTNHVQLDESERPVCHICGHTFKAVRHLQKHINIRHFGLETRQCDRCPYSARTNWDMKCHMKVHERNGRIRNRVPKIPFDKDILAKNSFEKPVSSKLPSQKKCAQKNSLQREVASKITFPKEFPTKTPFHDEVSTKNTFQSEFVPRFPYQNEVGSSHIYNHHQQPPTYPFQFMPYPK